jgi:hypothetical protein
MVHVSDRIPKISTNLPDVLFSWVSCIFPSIDNYLFFFKKKNNYFLTCPHKRGEGPLDAVW